MYGFKALQLVPPPYCKSIIGHYNIIIIVMCAVVVSQFVKVQWNALSCLRIHQTHTCQIKNKVHLVRKDFT